MAKSPGSRRALRAPSEPPPCSQLVACTPRRCRRCYCRPPSARPRCAQIPAAGPGRAQSLRAECPHCGPAAMATKIDKEACREAYNLVRDDGSAVIW